MNHPRNCIAFDDSVVCVQACDTAWAHIGIFVTVGTKIRSGHYHVDIPSLQRNAHEYPKPGQLSHGEFDAILAAHAADALALVARLNQEVNNA